MGICKSHNLQWAALVFVLPLFLGSYANFDCPLEHGEWRYKRVVNSACSYIQSHGREDPESLEPVDISLVVKNRSSGTLQVQFPLKNDDDISYYTVSLYIKESSNTTEKCRKFDERDVSKHCNRYFHSAQLLNNSDCKNVKKNPENCHPTCDLVGIVTFDKVYTGCYVVVVTINYSPELSDSPVYSTSQYLKTEYEKKPVWKMVPSVGEQKNLPLYGSEDWFVKIIVANFTMLFSERLLIDLYLQNNSKCDVDSVNDDVSIATWTLSLADDDKLIWRNQTNAPSFKGCERANEIVICEFTDMKVGNYCLGLQPHHPDQCRDSVWTYNGKTFNTCRYEYSFEIDDTPPGEPPREAPVKGPGSARAIILVTLAILISIIGVIVMYCTFFYHYRSPALPIKTNSASFTLSSQPKVLLLYAQDCEEFMNLMINFRQLLQEMGNCEVLDCFDHERTDVAACPTAWMQYWASKPDVKIVVVASPCASAHQQALSESTTLCYKDPINYSNLFTLGLKEVMHSNQRKYCNTFVVRFDDSDLNYVMPYTRYTLPMDVNELLRDLNMNSDSENLENSFIMKKLESEHVKLLDHHRRQPDYITSLLFKLTEA